MTYTLYKGDCLVEMNKIPDKSIDMILCDLPYGTTACSWDTIIPFEPLWKHYERIIKDNGAIVLTASEPFASYLRVSNIAIYKYDWIWEKERPSNPILANKQVLKYHEMICIFYKKQCNFIPQLRKRDEKNKRNNKPRKFKSGVTNDVPNSVGMNETGMNDFIKPKSVLKFNMERGLHPTQKPVALMEYLIKTYTNEGETVLDNCMGSGTTGVACKNTNRNFIGIEMDETYFNIAKTRIEEAKCPENSTNTFF
jgi:site-specific DNA-methyltransferase (adenine-specific)